MLVSFTSNIKYFSFDLKHVNINKNNILLVKCQVIYSLGTLKSNKTFSQFLNHGIICYSTFNIGELNNAESS